jgi:hypothetical protein
VPTLARNLLLVALIAWAACAAYTVWLNPEVRFYSQLSEAQDAWSRKTETEHTNKVVIYGGSSCMFAIDGKLMLQEFGLPVVNRGLAAGMGVKVLTLHALEDLKRGDTLIVALEPGQLTATTEPTSLGTQFSYAVGHPDWITRDTLAMPSKGWVSSLLALRPGSYHTLTLIGKMLKGRPMYRYAVADERPSGWMVTAVRLPIQGPPGHGDRLSDDVLKFLPALRDWCQERGVRVAYSMPWAYCPPNVLEYFRERNARTLSEIAEHIPVLQDPALGASTDATLFADTVWHLTEAGAALRSAQLGRAIQEWHLWSAPGLQSSTGIVHSAPLPKALKQE